MRQREAPWDEDFDYLFDESESRAWWEGATAVAEAAPAQPLAPEPGRNGRHRTDDAEGVGPLTVEPSISETHRPVQSRSPRPLAPAIPTFDAWAKAPKRRTLPQPKRRLVLIALAAAAGAVVVAILMLLLRSPSDDQPPAPSSVLPSSAPSASPSAPSAPAPDLSGGVPIEAPPPPPPTAEQITPAPHGSYPYHPRSSQPSEDTGPQIDVTRAPMSVAPKPVTPPKTATPGQGTPHHGFF
jgi:hypothetical protein